MAKNKRIIIGNLNQHFEAARSGKNISLSNRDSVEIKTASMKKEAAGFTSAAGGATNVSSQVLFTSPQFYSPIHTPTNWQIPSKRREVMLWCRFFASNNPVIASALRFYCQFPFTDFEHQMHDPVRGEHFDRLKKRLNLVKWVQLIAYEFFAIGDVFPFISFACNQCGGTGITLEGYECNHEGGHISKVAILNPDSVDVKMNPFDPDSSIISMMPDDTARNIVTSGKPEEIYRLIPDHMKSLILQNRPIPLSNRAVTHIKHDEIAYQTYGRSLLAPLFPTLAYQDKLKQAQWIISERHILPTKVVKVGNDQRPASSGDIADVQRQLGVTANDPNLTLVTHHAFDYEYVGASGKVLQLTKEYDMINKEIVQGLGVNEAILSSQGQGYAQAAIGIEATIRRLEVARSIMANWVEEHIYKQEARMQGFYKEDKLGNKVLDYPEIKWPDLNLRDKNQKLQLDIQLWDKGIVSTQYVCEQFGINYDIETERVRLEQQFQAQLGISPQSGGPGGPGGKKKPGGLGGGFGGGGPKGPGGGGGDIKGNMPGGGDAPPLPGDELAPSMTGGEGGPLEAKIDGYVKTSSSVNHLSSPTIGKISIAQNAGDNIEKAKEYVPNVRRPGKFKLQDLNDEKSTIDPWDTAEEVEDEEEWYEGPRTGAFRLTDIEQILYTAIAEQQGAGNLPEDFLWQEKPEPERMARVTVDGMFPSLRLIIEADGAQFHKSPDDIAKNQERDAELANYGWTVIRYTEDEIKHHIDEVVKNILETKENIVNFQNQTYEK